VVKYNDIANHIKCVISAHVTMLANQHRLRCCTWTMQRWHPALVWQER